MPLRLPLPALLVLAAALLAGCSQGPGGGGPALEADALADLGLEATATTGILRGFVVDEAIRPLPGALIEIAGYGYNTTSNGNGAFGFDGLATGTYFLTVTLQAYELLQQSASVVAGDSEPEPVKVVLSRLPQTKPYIEAYSVDMFSAFQSPFIGLGSAFNQVIGQNTGFLQASLLPTATVVQGELTWRASMATSQKVQWVVAARAEEGDSSKSVDLRIVRGASPLTGRPATTLDGLVATYFFVRIDAMAYDPSTLAPPDPAGAAIVNQQFRGIAHVFHNFQPREDWTFVRDGPYPIPE